MIKNSAYVAIFMFSYMLRASEITEKTPIVTKQPQSRDRLYLYEADISPYQACLKKVTLSDYVQQLRLKQDEVISKVAEYKPQLGVHLWLEQPTSSEDSEELIQLKEEYIARKAALARIEKWSEKECLLHRLKVAHEVQNARQKLYDNRCFEGLNSTDKLVGGLLCAVGIPCTALGIASAVTNVPLLSIEAARQPFFWAGTSGNVAIYHCLQNCCPGSRCSTSPINPTQGGIISACSRGHDLDEINEVIETLMKDQQSRL